MCREVKGPVFYNQTGVSPRFSLAQMQELGIAVTIIPGATFRATIEAVYDLAVALRDEGPLAEERFAERFKRHPLGDVHTFAGFDRIREWEAQYLPPEEAEKYADSVGHQPDAQMTASPVRKQIVVRWAAAASAEPDGSALDAYVLALAGKPRPKICFVPTASGDAPEYATKFYDLVRPPGRGAATSISSDARARTWRAFSRARTSSTSAAGTPRTCSRCGACTAWTGMMRDAWERGVILTGVSAGMICWFECGVTDSFGPLAALPRRPRLPPGQRVPALRRREGPAATYQRLVRGGFPAGYAADDGAALHFVDTDLGGLRRLAADGRRLPGTRRERHDHGDAALGPSPRLKRADLEHARLRSSRPPGSSGSPK